MLVSGWLAWFGMCHVVALCASSACTTHPCTDLWWRGCVSADVAPDTSDTMGTLINICNALNVIIMVLMVLMGFGAVKLFIKNKTGTLEGQDTCQNRTAPLHTLVPTWDLQREAKHRVWHPFWESVLLQKCGDDVAARLIDLQRICRMEGARRCVLCAVQCCVQCYAVCSAMLCAVLCCAVCCVAAGWVGGWVDSTLNVSCACVTSGGVLASLPMPVLRVLCVIGRLCAGLLCGTRSVCACACACVKQASSVFSSTTASFKCPTLPTIAPGFRQSWRAWTCTGMASLAMATSTRKRSSAWYVGCWQCGSMPWWHVSLPCVRHTTTPAVTPSMCLRRVSLCVCWFPAQMWVKPFPFTCVMVYDDGDDTADVIPAKFGELCLAR